jgi:hypothetical protein
MRFRKRVRVFPGFHLNFSMSGVSATIGVNGASVNFNKTGTYANTGLPGTGLYNRQKIKGKTKSKHNEFSNTSSFSDDILDELNRNINERGNTLINDLTSTSLIEIKESIQKAYQERNELIVEIDAIKRRIEKLKIIHIISCLFIFGLFTDSIKNKIAEVQEYLTDLNLQVDECRINIDIHFDHELESKYNKLTAIYNLLIKSEKIWDINDVFYLNTNEIKSKQTSQIVRTPVQFKFDHIEVIQSTYPAFHLENKNGGDLYIYPAFIIVTSDKKEFAFIDIKEVEFNFCTTGFLEQGIIPSDSQVIDTTWAKVNKNGQPDKRFKDNYEIPIVQYGEIHLKSDTGLNEVYLLSNYEHSKMFADEFIGYQNALKC